MATALVLKSVDFVERISLRQEYVGRVQQISTHADPFHRKREPNSQSASSLKSYAGTIPTGSSLFSLRCQDVRPPRADSIGSRIRKCVAGGLSTFKPRCNPVVALWRCSPATRALATDSSAKTNSRIDATMMARPISFYHDRLLKWNSTLGATAVLWPQKDKPLVRLMADLSSPHRASNPSES